MATMTPKQTRFCEEYLIDLNATQAATRAGYSARTAYRTGADNLRKPQIQTRIAELMERRSEATEITANWVLERLAKIADLDLRKLFDANGRMIPIAELDDSTAFALAGCDIDERTDKDGSRTITRKIKTVDKRAALELIARHLGMFIERIEQTNHFAEVKVVRIPDNNRGD